MSITITALDVAGGTTSPTVLYGWAPRTESANIVHNLLTPGAIAIVLHGDMPRSGSLSLVYDNDTDAEAARLLLGRPCLFTLTDSERPVVDMTFARYGQMSPAIHDEVENVWVFDVGYQEAP